MPVQSKKKKICIVAISLGKGGVERSCAMLSRMLDPLYDVHIVILNSHISYPYEGTLFDLGAFKTENDTLLKRLRRFIKLRKYLKEQAFDVIIDNRPKNNYKRELFYRRYLYRGFNTIYVSHSARAATYVTESPGKFARLCDTNKANVAVSHFIEDEVLRSNGFTNTTTIHNAFDPAWSEAKGDMPDNLSGKQFILSYGRIVDSIKDYSFLIEAYEASRLWEKNILLVIMGDGPDWDIISEKTGSSMASEFIHMIPFMKDPFEVIRNAHFVTLTSFYEGFPMVLVESLAVGTPVIALDIASGPSEIIRDGENGLLVSKRSIPLFVEAMHRMIEDENLYKQCKRSAKASIAPFSMESIARKWDKVLEL